MTNLASPASNAADLNAVDWRDPRTLKLLAAAKSAFLEHGFSAASMDQVARLAQASKTTLYSRFASKELLFAAVIRAECERRGMRFFPADFDHLDIGDALIEISDRFLALIWSQEALRMHQIVMGEALRQPHIAQLFHDAAIAPAEAGITAFFRHAIAGGRLPPGDPLFLGTQFFAALQGGPHCALSLGLGTAPPDDQRRLYAAQVIDLFLRGAGWGKSP